MDPEMWRQVVAVRARRAANPLLSQVRVVKQVQRQVLDDQMQDIGGSHEDEPLIISSSRHVACDESGVPLKVEPQTTSSSPHAACDESGGL